MKIRVIYILLVCLLFVSLLVCLVFVCYINTSTNDDVEKIPIRAGMQLINSPKKFSVKNKGTDNDVKTIPISAAEYEVKFNELFQEYWQNNRTISTELKNYVNLPRQPNLKIQELPDCKSPKKCLICRAFSFSLLVYYQKYSDFDLNGYLIDLCTVFVKQPYHICSGFVNIYAPTIKYISKYRANETTSDRICGILYQSIGCSLNKTLIDFTIKSDRKIKMPKKYDFDEATLNASDFMTIAQLTDFHYDPYYAPGSSSECMELKCCRNTSIPKPNSTKKAGYWGDYSNCNSPGHLVENICSQVANNHKNIDLIYYTGDFPDHFNWITSKSHVIHTVEFITQQIKEKFPNIPVIMVIGNHDAHPSNAFAPNATEETLSSKWLYEKVADLWSDWLPQSALSTLRIGGYYSFVFRPGFRIIVLNNNHCFQQNIWLLYSADEMIAQLEWLRDTLDLAVDNNEKVHIVTHVPPNTASCIRAWNREFKKLIGHYADIISGQFQGHTHFDDFSLIYSTDDEPTPLSVAWTAGSGTSLNGINSNYRLYTMESKTFEIIDHETYIFNLTEANLTPDQPPKWFKEYSFRDAFGVADLSPFTLSKLVNETFRHDRESLRKMYEFKFKQSDAMLALNCNDECLEEYRQITNGDLEDCYF